MYYGAIWNRMNLVIKKQSTCGGYPFAFKEHCMNRPQQGVNND